MSVLYTFRSATHYSDYIAKLRYGRKTVVVDGKEFEIDKPKGFQIDIFNIDFGMIQAQLRNSWKITVAKCPLCFWNDSGLAWLKPDFEERENWPNYVLEKFTLCPHKIYDKDFVGYRGGGKKNYIVIKYDNLQFFNHLNVNWKEWFKRLEQEDLNAPIVIDEPEESPALLN